MSRLNSLQGGAGTSRVSLDSTLDQSSSTLTPRDPPLHGQGSSHHETDKYDISNLLTDPSSTSAFLPSLPSLSQNTYLPTQLTSLGTTFTSSGTLPRSSTPNGKSVAQRRSQAPPLVQTELTRVAREEFQGYLEEIGKSYDQWERESRITRENLEDQRELDSAQAEEEEQESQVTVKKRKKRRGGGGQHEQEDELESLPPLDQVPSIFFDPTFNLSNPRTFDLVTERIQLTPSSSPSLTFSPRLPTTNHPTSSDEQELVIPGLGPTTLNDLASDQLLQEKLSHFTAVIESHLVREIGLRSSSFFSALSNLQNLHEQGSTTLIKIEELRDKLSDREKGVNGTSRHGLKVLRLQARRRGLERIEESVRAVEEVASALEGVKELVENGEWVDALEVAETIQEAYEKSAVNTTIQGTGTGTRVERSSQGPPGLDLTKLSALRSLPLKLSLIRAQIAKSLEGELISVLEHEMDLGIESGIKRVREGKTNSRREGQEEEEGGEVRGEGRDRMRERTRPVVNALVRSEGMDSAVQAWRESVLREVRAMVREHLPTGEEGNGGDPEEEDPFASAAIRSVSKQSIDLGAISDKSLSLAKKLRAMPHEAFLRLARETYIGLIACIETVDVQSSALLELVSQSREEERVRKSKRRTTNGHDEPTDPPLPSGSSLAVPGTEPSLSSSSLLLNGNSEDSASSLSTEITDVLTSVTELSNVRFSKVIGVRSEVHSHLSLEEFLEIFDETWSFVLRCEVLVKRMIVGLRGAMVSQSKGWLMTFHQKRINENAKLVEEEQWSASEVPLEVQRNVELIVKGAMVDPEELLIGQRKKIGEDGKGKEAEGAAEERPEAAKQIEIEGRQFYAVSAGLATIGTLTEYLKVVLNCPMLTTDAMSKIIEFMKVFNSRSCQVVLGAGAMRSAGLKNITAKNLALASQALSIMVSLIPYIRELIRRHLNPKQAVMLTEFDKLKRDYQEHQNEIHFKLVAIMSDRLIVHSRTLDTMNWEEPSPRPGQPNSYMESLVKEHLTLYKVLSRFLHTETVFSIMSQVFKALDEKLGEEYDRIDFKSSEAKDRVLVDVRYLQEKLEGLKGLEENGPGKSIETLVLAKSLPEKANPPPPPAPAPPAVDHSSSALKPPPAAIETPLPTTPSLWTSLPPSASASALSLALPDAPSTPRTSLDAPPSNYSPPVPRRDRSPSPGPQLSPVPVPAPLPPSPKPAQAPYKKKSLAERLAERMGRKPTEAVPPQQPGRSSLEMDSRPTQSELEEMRRRKEDEKLLEEVQEEIPVWTPKGEKELEEVERQIEREIQGEGLGIVSLPSQVEEAKSERTEEVQERIGETPSVKEEDSEPTVHVAEPAVTVEEQPEASEPSDPKGDEDSTAVEPPRPPIQPVEEPNLPTLAVDDAPDSVQKPVSSATPEPKVPEAQSTKELERASLVVEPPTPEEKIDAEPFTSQANATTKAPEAEMREEAKLEQRKEETSTPVIEAKVEPEPSLSSVVLNHSDLAPTVVAENSTPSVEPLASPTSELSKGSSPPPLVPAISIPAAADVPVPPSAPSTPVSSPPQRPSSASSLPEIASPPAASSNPARKKTLKERLAEAARRGSTGSSLVNVTSSPPASRPSLELPPVRESTDAQTTIASVSGEVKGPATSIPSAVITNGNPPSSTVEEGKVGDSQLTEKNEEKGKAAEAEEQPESLL
ncbi:hypothetical protein JCM16303_003338 [Sporobolomyces ruberrimus]